MVRHRELGSREYPHFLVRVWGGRLPVPPQFRGTSIAKQFESGRVGGRRIVEERRFADNVEGRRAMVEAYRRAGDSEVYFISGPNRARRRIRVEEVFAPSFIREGLTRR